MKKTLKFSILIIKIIFYIPIHILVVMFFYLPAWVRYQKGLEKGMHCTKIDQGIFTNTFHYNSKIAPHREYLTFREFYNYYFGLNPN